ncbi:EexN family lipoprotein [Campylobacter sp. JMF_06 NA1]|uniref:EexN family lipoprotein n=1 Tax=Campylobacter sp. JMF_06 NA1 TaxID=2983823 RepID=UPI0022E9B2A4|nr:EexN family lipoprotein [Campylobacter sp. JMF_06 NA1]MDA3078106.1 EexN family lipoprotein [Campylobacter sp. JMF_06 NA1]
MKFIKFCAIVAFCAVFLGCESEKSVDYYRANLSAAKERVAQCKGIKNKSKKTAKECANASTALSQVAAKMDLEANRAKLSIGAIVQDFTTHYIAQGEFGAPASMSGVSLPLRVGSVVCAEFERKSGDEMWLVINRDDEFCAVIYNEFKRGEISVANSAKIIVK